MFSLLNGRPETLTESERHPIRVARAVVVGIPVVVDIAEVGGVALIRRLAPPVVAGPAAGELSSRKRPVSTSSRKVSDVSRLPG